MTVELSTLTPELRFALFAVVSTGAGLLTAQLGSRTGAAVRHRLCLAGLVAPLVLPVAWLVLPPVRWVVGEVAIGGGAAPAEDGFGRALVAVWGVVTALLLLRTAYRVASVDRLFRTATPLNGGRITRASLRAVEVCGLRARPRIVTHAEVANPATWGLWRSVVFLPVAARDWSEARLRAVLLHEFTHVARRDALTQLLAEVSCAVFWFVPFAWLAAARMRLEREIACDASVVRAGARASGYARFLVRSTCAGRDLPAGAAGLGGGSALERRVRALLDPSGSERRVRRSELGLVALGAVVMVALGATLTPVQRVAFPSPQFTASASHRGSESASSPMPDRGRNPLSDGKSLPGPKSPSGSTPERGAAMVGRPGSTHGPVSVPEAQTAFAAPLVRPEAHDVPSLAELMARRTPGATRRRIGADAAAALMDADGRLLGGALRRDPEHGMVIDADELCRFLGLPESMNATTVIVPHVVRLRR